jgi:hypothetical protein
MPMAPNLTMMNWQHDQATAQAATNFPLPLRAVVPAQQFPGFQTNSSVWTCRVLSPSPWRLDQPLCSSPEYIIDLFRQGFSLHALAMVVSWGIMWRRPESIYGARSLHDIQDALRRAANSIQQTNGVQSAWDTLTGHAPGQLGWSAVMVSKSLHFPSRALGYDKDPPVPRDNAVMVECVWRAFIRPIPPNQRPRNWSGNTFAAYSRFMTAIVVWARQRQPQWTTTEMETTIFDEYR